MGLCMKILDIGKLIIQYGAPLLGFAIGGNAGSAIVSEIASLFGADASNPSDIISKIQADPDAKVKLAQIEASKATELQQIAFNTLKAQYDHIDHQTDDDVKDVEDARKMMETTHDWFPHVLSTLIILAFITGLILCYKVPIPNENRDIILGMSAAMMYSLFMVCRFWLGGIMPNLKVFQGAGINK